MGIDKDTEIDIDTEMSIDKGYRHGHGQTQT